MALTPLTAGADTGTIEFYLCYSEIAEGESIMPVRKAHAQWNGDLKSGKGSVSTETGVVENASYNFSSRFESGKGTNPEELIAAAHAACYSMALSAGLSAAGHKVVSVATEARVHVVPDGGGFKISQIELSTEGRVEGVDEAAFKKAAEDTKVGCPVSAALKAVPMTLTTKLLK
jgi:lipoyl-dependent peroxiredoxin